MTESKSSTTALANQLLQAVAGVLLLGFLYQILLEAYNIRLYAIKEYGLVIHEFDPYFNYRATEYLYEHGWYKFRTWFDYMVWYPLGRPVGTTIYPGMQVTAVWIKNHVLQNMSVNDICCYIPAWFGSTATLAVAWLAYECTRESAATPTTFHCILQDVPGVQQVYQYLIQPVVAFVLSLLNRFTGPNALGIAPRTQSVLTAPMCAVAAAMVMSVVPAHLLRSVAGGYDNESIAMTAMVMTFASWTFSLRDGVSERQTMAAAVMSGLAYFYMVAAWGGYVFVLNVVGVHAVTLVLLSRYTTKLHRAYTIFYLVGTSLAIQVPVVGWTPLKSLEQLGPALAFLCFQLIEFCEYFKRRNRLSVAQVWKLRVQVFGAAAAAGVLAVAILAPTGYFGPISSRVRGLFVKHTKTGNPLVDSVAEHQAASPEAYLMYLHELVYLSPVAWAATGLFFCNDSSSFLIVYGLAAYFFSHKMVRLILLTAPIASVLGGIFMGRLAAWTFQGTLELLEALADLGADSSGSKPKAEDDNETSGDAKKAGGASKGSKNGAKKKKDVVTSGAKPSKFPSWIRLAILAARLAAATFVFRKVLPLAQDFHAKAHLVAKQISHPTIIQKGQTKDGEMILLDDYREAYWWLRDHTPEDSRIMAWWDYGYQITGIGNRTTLADGNTWNHEHIALLGRTLTAPEKEAHRIARHLADYVLVWAGGGGDDVAKSPHLRRIANSVYRGLCSEPTCREFGFYSDRNPTPDMAASLLYKLHSHGLVPGIQADNNRFRLVYNSKYGKVRIFKVQSVSKESKEWVPKNRVCDAPGSWFCKGLYPPALEKILKEKKDFKQLEDFNVKDGDDSEYQKKYFENLNRGGHEAPPKEEKKKAAPKTLQKLPSAQIEAINKAWQNNDATSQLYNLIAADRVVELREVLSQNPQLAHIRSEDGRGPMFWAHEHSRKPIIDMLKFMGVSETREDASGMTPLDIVK